MFWTSWRAWSTNHWSFLNGGAGLGRYGMLETLRQFALEQLEVCDEAADVRRRHAAYFVALAEEAEVALMGPEQRAWQARLDDEHNNIQVTFDWLDSAEARSVQARPEEAALRMAGALWRYWEVRGHVAEGRARLLPLLAAGRPGDAGDRTGPRLFGGGHLHLVPGRLRNRDHPLRYQRRTLPRPGRPARRCAAAHLPCLAQYFSRRIRPRGPWRRRRSGSAAKSGTARGRRGPRPGWASWLTGPGIRPRPHRCSNGRSRRVGRWGMTWARAGGC